LYHQVKPVVIGICGGSCSGKSFISSFLKRKFEELKFTATILKEKNFLKQLNLEQMDEEQKRLYIKNYDFDNPHAIDWELFREAV